MKFFNQRFLLWSGVCSVRACLYFPLSLWYFPLSHSVLFADCMFSLGFGALQAAVCGAAYSGPVLVYLSLSALCLLCLQAFLSLFVPPTTISSSHCFQLNVFVFTGCRNLFSIPVSVCLYTFFLDIHSRKNTFWSDTEFLRHFSLSLFFSPSAFSHSSLVWKQERALFEQYYSCPLWLWSRVGHQSVPPLANRREKALLQSTRKAQFTIL